MPATRTAVVVLSWNDLEFLKRTLETFTSLNGKHEMLVIDNGSSDGTAEYLAQSGYKFTRHESNLGVFEATLQAWQTVAREGYEFVLNVQSDFPSVRRLPLGPLEHYLDRNPDVGFVRLNDKKHFTRNGITGRAIEVGPWEPLWDGFRVAKYNYHMSFHPYLFRAEFVRHFDNALVRKERGLMGQYETLGKRGAIMRPACFATLPYSRHDTPGWCA